MNISTQILIIILMPLIGACLSGIFCCLISRKCAHTLTITLMFISVLLSVRICFKYINYHVTDTYLFNWYQWGFIDELSINIGVMLDALTALMLLMVSSISLIVHIYSIGYMATDDSYQRFFSYISLFTFSMYMLVCANNFVQLFFSWEAVGFISYLLIGFWYKKETAIFANLKAFLINRIGDFGLLIGIAFIYHYFQALDYITVFKKITFVFEESSSGQYHSVLTWICLSLFMGAMSKSAQIPLHIWLPDSMEGPTPVSALIHAATMVTAGIFMVARLSPIFECSDVVLNVILIIGAITSIFIGLLAIVKNNIKLIIAYSTISQLGYMVAGLGASAYVASIFHLITHAFFKTLLFLGAGSIIIALHHEQDIRKMGNLRKYLPITYVSMIIGSLALIGFPGLSGFFSKDMLIKAVLYSNLSFASYAYWMLLLGVFITAVYSFRILFIVFHGNEHMNLNTKNHLHKVSNFMLGPIALLIIPVILCGWLLIGTLMHGLLNKSIFTLPEHQAMYFFQKQFHNAFSMFIHGLLSMPSLFTLLGIFVSWLIYVKRPKWLKQVQFKDRLFYRILCNNYGFDLLYVQYLVPLIRIVSEKLWLNFDQDFLDSYVVNGSAKSIMKFSSWLRHMQTGLLSHYLFIAILGVLVFTWLPVVIKWMAT